MRGRLPAGRSGPPARAAPGPGPVRRAHRPDRNGSRRRASPARASSCPRWPPRSRRAIQALLDSMPPGRALLDSESRDAPRPNSPRGEIPDVLAGRTAIRWIESLQASPVTPGSVTCPRSISSTSRPTWSTTWPSSRSSARSSGFPPSAKELGDELTLVAGQEWAKKLLVNLKHTKYLCSTGFAILFNLVKQARQQGNVVKFCEPGSRGPDRGRHHRPGQDRPDPRQRSLGARGLRARVSRLGVVTRPSAR